MSVAIKRAEILAKRLFEVCSKLENNKIIGVFMFYEFSRTELLIGEESLKKLKNSKVAVFGVGGVGSFAVEALVRAGVGRLVLLTVIVYVLQT